MPRKKGKEATIELRFEKLTIKSPQYEKLENIDTNALTATKVDRPKEESINWRFLTQFLFTTQMMQKNNRILQKPLGYRNILQGLKIRM
ncbi:hypothetical protein LEP1GSC191_1989 [Leptospira borgpetersenii serovar Mini str. 201000851]|uniref:Uncharacterized protein n=2 Tax=Leptospira borgpetersenii TaxID=174 RepID=M3HIC4_LEPBO|nr:hypothetical protein LEP1GSC128_2899 [Leptospira borgpetersenii str. 200801926]EMF97865.1 hypothetical protein LEP1GSC123_4207 [Leptospira borgpetersenii str. 200701203]ENO63513.1 hypothetical protein LEP1GSC191_1989 [Leptospira borgpetersenii serovar Mini str. 201000851]